MQQDKIEALTMIRKSAIKFAKEIYQRDNLDTQKKQDVIKY